jgi:hypothetical protein
MERLWRNVQQATHGGLAAVLPGTPLVVKSDFSFLKTKSGKHSTSLTALSLESKLHAKWCLEWQKIKLVLL